MNEEGETRGEPLLGFVAEGGEAALNGLGPRFEQRRGGKEVPGIAALGSLALHLALLLALLFYPLRVRTPPVAPPIPVRLVVVKPPPKPALRPRPKPPVAEKKPRGRIASVSMGEHAQKRAKERAPAPAKPAAAPPASEPEKAPPKPPSQTAMAVPLPLPKPPAPPQTRPSPRRPPAPAPARAEALPQYPGPSATRSAYLAYLAALTREHIGLLTRNMVGNRQGETVIGVDVRDNGAIARIYVLRGSGYPGIDRRVEMMVEAVGRFPPLPQIWQQSEVALQFRLGFPGGLPQ